MTNKLLLASTVLVAALALPGVADATPDWHLSPSQGTTCSGFSTFIGYYGEVTPNTGDNPNSAVMVRVQNGNCSNVVIPEFHLPPQVRQDTSQPVECYRARSANGVNEPLDNFPANQGDCSTTSLPGLPNIFGWSTLQPNERLEIYIPVTYAAPMTNGQFSVTVGNNFANVTPVMTFSVNYRPLFASYATSLVNAGGYYDSSSLQLSFRLDHFHVAGQLYIDYGTTTSLGTTGMVGTVDAQYEYYTSVTPKLGGLTAGTVYYWRPRLVTSYGTFYGAMQSAMTCARRTCAIRHFP